MYYTKQQIDRINSGRLAESGVKYTQDNGLIWIGTYTKRLVLFEGNPALPIGASTDATLAERTTPLDTQPISSVDLGVKADSSASSDTGTFSLISLFKRLLEKFTTLNAKDFATRANQDTANSLLTIISTLIPKNYFFEISKGNIPGSSTITKFGLNDDVDTGTLPEDLWGINGTYVQPTTARIHNFVSTSASDTMTILIRGINDSFNAVSETITMNGLTNVPTVNSYVHIHLLQNTGSTNNIGVITGTAITDGTVTINMPIGFNQSVSTIYMVPVGYKGYIVRVRGKMTNPVANSGATIQLLNKPFGGVFQLKTQMGLNNSGTSFIELDYTNSTPFIVQGKSMTKLTVLNVTNSNTSAEGEYDLILVQD